MNIYLDMDDVVADWLGFARAYLNEPAWVQGQLLPDHIWATLKQAPRMYRNLPKKEGADELVNWVTNYAEKRHCGLRFLSAIPHQNDTPWAIPDKHEWARQHYPHIPVFLGPYSHEKYMHCKSPEDILIDDPSELLEMPRIGRKLPEILSIEEIDQLISAVDMSKNEGHRNRAIIETLYSCGLRVSELVNLRFSDLFFEEGFIRVIGKGNKERLVPVSKSVEKEIDFYNAHIRCHQNIQSGNENIVFLNRRGAQLTRVMIFTIIKDLSAVIGLKKSISPHTFRHSFATHMIEGGANLRAVQDMLGHESITTTEIYTHLDQRFLRDAIISFHPRNKE